MSAEAMNEFVEKTLEDVEFRRELARDPESVLSRFDLTEEERAAIMGADPVRLEELGVDERLTKRTGGPSAPCCGQTVVK